MSSACGKRITVVKVTEQARRQVRSRSQSQSQSRAQAARVRLKASQGDAPRTWRPALELRVWRTFWGALVSAGAATGALDFPPPFLGGIVRVYVCV